MFNKSKICLGAVALSFMFVSTVAYAGEIRIGITMRMVSENGQKYGQMMMDEIDIINKAGGINGNKIVATLMNDECKSDKGVANAIKLVSQKKSSSCYRIYLFLGNTADRGCDSEGKGAANRSTLYKCKNH